MRYIAFGISLVPIPLMQQAAQIVDRMLSDVDSAQKLEEIWAELARLNSKVADGNLEESIIEVAATVAAHPELQRSVEWILEELGEGTTFSVVSETGGLQTLINSIVEAERAQFIATSAGSNVLHGVSVRANHTLLRATDKGQNFVSNAEFSSAAGAVTMSGITAVGAIGISGPGISLSENSGLMFGGQRLVRYGVCPACKNNVTFEMHEIKGKSEMPCPHCGTLSRL